MFLIRNSLTIKIQCLSNAFGFGQSAFTSIQLRCHCLNYVRSRCDAGFRGNKRRRRERKLCSINIIGVCVLYAEVLKMDLYISLAFSCLPSAEHCALCAGLLIAVGFLSALVKHEKVVNAANMTLSCFPLR